MPSETRTTRCLLNSTSVVWLTPSGVSRQFVRLSITPHFLYRLHLRRFRLVLRVVLPVQLGFIDRNSSLVGSCVTFVQTHFQPNIQQHLSSTLTGFAQSLHIFDSPPHVSHKVLGTSQDCPFHMFCTILSEVACS